MESNRNQQSPSQVDKVRDIFNEMADEYDNLNDLWYRHTFAFIDKVLCEQFSLEGNSSSEKPVALDVGCGTGIQSLRLAQLGYKVIGVDIADELLIKAERKLKNAGYKDAEFHITNAESLPFSDSVADCINCCGPTLSFVPDWRKALAEVGRCLKPKGKFLLEVEGKWNPDMLWEIINALGFNFLGYDESLATSLGHLLPPWRIGHSINYSFRLESGETVSMPLRLFTPSELSRELKEWGLIEDRRWGLHVITNVFPSTVLHKPDPGKFTREVFRFLSSVEGRVNHVWPFNAFSCSMIVSAHRFEGDSRRGIYDYD